MSVKSGYYRFPQDALLVLRAQGQAGVTATTVTSSIQLDAQTAYWAAGDSAEPNKFAIQTQVESLAGTSPTITFHVQVAGPNDPNFTSPIEVLVSEPLTAVGFYTLTLAAEEVAVFPGGGFLRLNAVIGGTTPVVAFNAFQAPLLGR
jgi:hypothetical protein